MIGYEQVKNNKILEVIERQEEYDFPQFLNLLRSSIGGKRAVIAKDLNISSFLLFHWENGKFSRNIKVCHLANLADYYHVSLNLLEKKMKDFIREKNENCN